MDDPPISTSPIPEVVKEYPDRDPVQHPHTKYKPKEHKRRGRPPGQRIAPPKKVARNVSEYIGMTRDNCSDNCRQDRCVVSNRAYCAHPRKGGLQGPDLGNVSAVNRLTAAKAYLAKQGG